MTLDEHFRDQLSRGQPPLVALHNAAQAYAESIGKRPDCSQYADETEAWSEPQDSEAVELLREQCQRMKKYRDNGGCLTFGEYDWFCRVLKFLEGKQ